jgi:hypothetical protein
MTYTFRFLVIFLVLPGVVLAQAKSGFYSGYINCVESDGVTDTFPTKIQVKDGQGFIDPATDIAWEFLNNIPNTSSYTMTELDSATNSDGEVCVGRRSMSVNSQGGVVINFRPYCEKSKTFIESRCGGSLVYTSIKDNITFKGSSILKESRCYNVKKKTKFKYYFSDTGGFLTRFRLVTSPCGEGYSKTIVDYKEYQFSGYLEGHFKLPKGRWKFSVRNTGKWAVDGLPGIK